MESRSEAAAKEAEAQAEPLPEIVPAVEAESTTEVKVAEVMQPEVPAEAEGAEVLAIEQTSAPEPAVVEQAEPEAPAVVEAEGASAAVAEPAEVPIAAKPSDPGVTPAPKILQQESASSPDGKVEGPEAAKPVIAEPKSEPRTMPRAESRPEPTVRIKFESLMAEPELQAPSRQEVPAKEATPKASIPHRSPSFEVENTKSSGWLKGSAWVAAIVVLVLAPAAWLYLPSHRQEEAPQPQAQTQPVPAAAPQPAPVQPAAAPAPEQPGANEDPAVVVSQWEEAMQSRDAAAQAAFYANPVERYFLRHNVSKEDVLADRQSAIERRKGVWTVKMEQVKITRPKDGTARVSVIKHYRVQEEGSPVSEWFVPSVLLLVREDGRWQITSERDLGWAASMDELEG